MNRAAAEPGPRLLFAGGGTGGHIVPARNLAERVDPEGGGRVHFLTAGRPVEEAFFREAPWPCTPLFPPEGKRPPLHAPGAWAAALRRARAVRNRFRPHVLFLLGGYVSLPSLLALLGTGIPRYALEPNAVPGRAARLTAPFCRRVFCHFPAAARRLGRRAVVTGSPLSRGFGRSRERRDETRRALGLAPGLPTLLVAGGSQGARALNERITAAFPLLARALGGRLQLLHVTGLRDYPAVRAAWERGGVKGAVHPFLDPMEPAYAAADLVLCRGGAMTVAEVSAAGLPAVIVPYPHHKDRHQYENARELVEEGGARLLEEGEMTPEGTARLLEELFRDPARLARMARAARRAARTDGAERILSFLEKDLEGDPEMG